MAQLSVEFMLRIESDIWLSINGVIYLYSFDSSSDWDYYENKFGRNKGRLIDKIKPFCKGKVSDVGRYE